LRPKNNLIRLKKMVKTETIGKFSNIDTELSADEKALIQGYVLKNKPTYSTRVPEKREEIVDEYEKYEKTSIPMMQRTRKKN